VKEDGTDRKSKFSPRFSIDARNNSSPVDQAAFARTSDEDDLKPPHKDGGPRVTRVN
jgi:hypothetical protein